MVQTQLLHKEYTGKVALEDVSLELSAGDICGLIGTNGSGKTTLLRILATLIKPTSGTATINGYDVVKAADTVKPLIGYVPEVIGGYDDLKVWEYLDFFASAYRIARNQRPGLIEDVLGLTDLTEHREMYIQHLSRGLKQRLCLAKTLLHDPAVFLLDEPATGIDYKGRIVLRELFQELGAMGKTVIIVSNILSDLAEMCNKVGFLNSGKLLYLGTVEYVLAQMNIPYTIEIKVLDDVEKTKVLLLEQPNITRVDINGETLTAEYIGNPQEMYTVLNALVFAEIKILMFQENTRRLEQAFLSLAHGFEEQGKFNTY